MRGAARPPTNPSAPLSVPAAPPRGEPADLPGHLGACGRAVDTLDQEVALLVEGALPFRRQLAAGHAQFAQGLLGVHGALLRTVLERLASGPPEDKRLRA